MATTSTSVLSVTVEHLVVGGRPRSFLTVAPARLLPGAALVLVLHGSNQTAAKLRAATGGAFDALSAGGDAVVTYLDGYRGTWNDARASIDFPARREGVDDVAFVEAVVDAVGAARGTDPNRVYAIGFSNGGQMVIRLLHQVPDRLAGAALIAATQPVRANFLFADAAAVPRPVLLIHGTKDPVAPYEGGMTSLFGFRPRGLGLSAQRTARYYAERNGIDTAPTTSDLPHRTESRRTSVTRTDYRGPGREPVTLFTVTGGGHVIPGPKAFPRLMGRTTRDLDTATAVSDFFGVRASAMKPEEGQS